MSLAGTVSYASSTRLEVQVQVAGSLRGAAGAPILRRTDGRVVGVLQTLSSGSNGIALARATPAEAIIPRIAEAEGATGKPLPLEGWGR